MRMKWMRYSSRLIINIIGAIMQDNESKEKIFEVDQFSHLFGNDSKKIKSEEKMTPAREIDIKYREKTENRIKYVERK